MIQMEKKNNSNNNSSNSLVFGRWPQTSIVNQFLKDFRQHFCLPNSFRSNYFRSSKLLSELWRSDEILFFKLSSFLCWASVSSGKIIRLKVTLRSASYKLMFSKTFLPILAGYSSEIGSADLTLIILTGVSSFHSIHAIVCSTLCIM